MLSYLGSASVHTRHWLAGRPASQCRADTHVRRRRLTASCFDKCIDRKCAAQPRTAPHRRAGSRAVRPDLCRVRRGGQVQGGRPERRREQLHRPLCGKVLAGACLSVTARWFVPRRVTVKKGVLPFRRAANLFARRRVKRSCLTRTVSTHLR